MEQTRRVGEGDVKKPGIAHSYGELRGWERILKKPIKLGRNVDRGTLA